MAVMKHSENDLKRRIKEETSDDEETSVSVPLPAKRSKDCPYLDSINRKVLDFGKSQSSPSQEFVQKISLHIDIPKITLHIIHSRF